MWAEQHTKLLLEVASRVCEMARLLGADSCDAMAGRSTDFEVKVADSEILTLTQATSKGLGLRVFVQGRMGFCTTTDFSLSSLEHAVTRAVAMAREAAIDQHNGLAQLPQATPHAKGHDLDLFDPAIVALSPEEKIDWAHALEAAARRADPRVRKFRDSGVATEVSSSVLVTSQGVQQSMERTGISAWSTPVAEADGQLQTEVWYDAQSHLADMEPIDAIGHTAGKRAARMLGAKPVKTQRVPVIFEPGMAAGLFGGMIGAMTGDMVSKKASFLADKLGEGIATPLLTLVDDPMRKRGMGSSPFDGEGLPTSTKNLVDQGKLTTFLYDSYQARKAGVAPTASARRSYGSLPHASVFNLYVAPGKTSLQDIYKSVPKALVVTRGLGAGLNTVSGEYSRGANGLWIENGEVVHAVQEVTIAEDFLTMLHNIDRVGDDLHIHGTSGAPTLRIAEMTVSGSA